MLKPLPWAVATLIFFIFSCSEKEKALPFNVVPYPLEVEFAEGTFDLSGAGFFADSCIDTQTIAAISDFMEDLKAFTGRRNRFSIGETSERGVIFELDEALSPEEYSISIDKRSVVVHAACFNGFMYALQTIRQMLPASVYVGQRTGEPCLLPCGFIQDKPRFTYRGLLLDVGRHFFSTYEVRRIIDMMSVYKLNKLHLHLSEDQGWRIAINKYPELTGTGSVRRGTQVGYDRDSLDGAPYGGFYTQEEMRGLVSYASSKGITIIPEIDLPGHMLSALAAYPDLGCTGGPYEVATTWGVKKDVLCAGREETFSFIEDVLSEIMDIFPSEYINIGGDEVPKDRWSECPHCQRRIRELGLKDSGDHSAEQYLQNYVTSRVQDFLGRHGRKVIGWSEILEGNLAEGVTVISWKGTEEGEDDRIWNFDCVMSPRMHMYFDRYQSEEQEQEPISIGGFLPVEHVYNYEPYKDVPEYGKARILGVQANLWTEYIDSDEYLEYMLLPRLAALSEVQWCSPRNKQYVRFRVAMEHQRNIYDAMGYTYAKHLWGILGMEKSRNINN